MKDEAQCAKTEAQGAIDRMHARYESDKTRTNETMEEMQRLWRASTSQRHRERMALHVWSNRPDNRGAMGNKDNNGKRRRVLDDGRGKGGGRKR